MGREGEGQSGIPYEHILDSMTETCSGSSSWFLVVGLGLSLGIYVP